MLEKITNLPNLIRRKNNHQGSFVLESLSEKFRMEIKARLADLRKFTDSLATTQALHLTIDNLTNTKSTIDKTLRQKDLINADAAIALLEEQIEQGKEILQNSLVAHSSQASEIGLKTLNMLFSAKQEIKQTFLVITPISLPEIVGHNGQIEADTKPKLLPTISETSETPRMLISSTLLYQLHHSLFPAERMLVGAGRKNGQNIEIDGIFDVTGQATSGYVKADADRLARALIVMSETEKHFALWIHSHPGRGKGATHPSNTDTNQEAE
ncbi:MAG: hypothetical protein ACR2MG_10830 [Pyrinomonadaceae bacterium]